MSVKVSPIGGIDQIGGNLTLYQFDDISMAIDCGIKIPNDSYFGIQHLIPNLDELPLIDVLVITHGHEDHIGAIPYLIEKNPKIKIFCSKFTYDVIRTKYGISLSNCTFAEGEDTFQVSKSYWIDFFPLYHSIPETFGVLVYDDEKSHCIFHASDYKTNISNCPNEFVKSLKRLNSKASEFQERIILSDSTNILSGSDSGVSEREVKDNLEVLFNKFQERIFITTFSSNIERINNIINLAFQNGREVLLYGKAMSTMVKIALRHDFISEQENIRFHPEECLNPESAIILLSGSQGEIRSKLNAISRDTDPFFKLNQKDTVIFSSKTIPGNEISIASILNNIAKQGAKVITASRQKIHSSGHAYRSDLREMYRTYKPTLIIPIHGDYSFIKAHEEFIREELKSYECALLTHHSSLIVGEGAVRVTKSKESRLRYIDEDNVELKKEHLSERKKLASRGLITVVIHKNNTKIVSHGVSSLSEEELGSISDFALSTGSNNEIKIASQVRGYIKKTFRRNIQVEVILI